MVVIVNLHSDRFMERCEIFVARKAACLTPETAKLSEAKNVHTHILEEVDHNFSGESLEAFIAAPALYLFD